MAASILEIRCGKPTPVAEMLKKVPHWEVKEYASGYLKKTINGPVAVSTSGIEGNLAGFKGHLDDIHDRAVLVFFEPVYKELQEKFPESRETLVRGGFGENVIVDHPTMCPSKVCIGDVYEIGSVLCTVTAPRQPCPKVDTFHKTKGLTEYTKQNGLAGYFFKVLRNGSFNAGDSIVLVERPYPSLSVQTVSRGLWGSPEARNNSREFLESLVDNKVLMGHMFRSTAFERLKRLDEETGKQWGFNVLCFLLVMCTCCAMLYGFFSKLI